MSITVEQVHHCYNAVLRREPSQGEVRLWTGGGNIERSSAGMVDALIAQATVVRSIARLYAGLLGRLPDGLTGSSHDTDDLAYWTGLLHSFRSEHAGISYREALTYLVDEWLREPELRTRFTDDDIYQYVIELCQAVLDRAPESDEAAAWVEIAADPERGRASLAVALSESKECKARFNNTINEKLREQAGKRAETIVSPRL